MVTRIHAKNDAVPAENARFNVKKMTQQASRALHALTGHHGERMSKVDTAWLRMDAPNNLMMIVGVLVVQPRISYASLLKRVRSRILHYPRFLQCVIEDAAGATWMNDPLFDLSHHVVKEALPTAARNEIKALQQRLAQLATEPLNRKHPLWQFHYIENYQGGSAILVRMHHCIADGLALLSVMQSLVDGGQAPQRVQPTPPREVLEGAEDWLVDSLLKPLTNMTIKALNLAGDSAVRSIGLRIDTEKNRDNGLAESVDVARLAYQTVMDFAALALMPDDSPTRLKGVPGTQKRVAWCDPLPLDEVKAVSKALDCSINDLLLSCAAGAIGAYLARCGDATEGLEIRVMVPVNLREPENSHELGNQFGLAPLLLPIGMTHPVRRLYEVRQRMTQLKTSMQPLLSFGLLALAGILVKPAQDALLGLFSKKTTAVMTNVPGPSTKHTMCGSTIEQALFWVPQSGSVGLGISILSYGGGVQFGIVADAGLCPQPQKIIDHFQPEFSQLALVALMMPWSP
jgi:diacylglycerol O-acyltransferase / wax synthase